MIAPTVHDKPGSTEPRKVSRATNDPYAKAGFFDSVTLNAWNRVVG